MVDEGLIVELLEECGFSGSANWKGEMPLQYCCFHEHGFNSPSLQINIQKQMFVCYSCHHKGHIRRIFYHFGIAGEYFTNGVNTNEDFESRLKKAIESLDYFPEDERNTSDIKELENYRFLHPYLLKRGYSETLLKLNKVGFNKLTARVTIPVFYGGEYYGVIQRTVIGAEPKYIYPRNFQKSAVLYEPKTLNEKDPDIELWCEGSLDALKAAQHGYKARAILGCSISKVQLQKLEESPREIVLALDNDDPGRRGVDEFLQHTSRFDVSVIQFPENVKDVGEMSEEQLNWAITNRKSRLTYNSLLTF